MATVHYDIRIDDAARRQMLYEGDIFIYSPTKTSLALCNLARELLQQEFAPLEPDMAQYGLPVEEYAAKLARVKPAFIHHPRCKELIPEMMEHLGCDPAFSYFDVPRLRTSTSDGYLTTGIAYAFHPHRDTWYSAPQCQINWWFPVSELSSTNCMTFYPRYFSRQVKNSSHTYNYHRWNRESRMTAVKHIGKDTRVQPKPEEPLELESDLRLIPPVGGLILFSGAQLHASVENTSGRTRISIDFRTVNLTDIREHRGAQNIDSSCTGTSLRDFLRCSDLSLLPEELVKPYDTAEADLQIAAAPPA